MNYPRKTDYIETARLREIATKYRYPQSDEEALILLGAETALQHRQDETPHLAPSYLRKATAREMHA